MNYKKLEKAFEKYSVLNNIKSILEWDSMVNLPKKSVSGREKQIRYIENETNDFLKDKKLSMLLKQTEKEGLNKWQQKNLILMKKAVAENSIYPLKLVENIGVASLKCETLWREAKAQNNFSIVRNALQDLILLIKEKASYRGEWLGKSNYESLIDIYSPGLKLETLNKIFDELRSKLPKIISGLHKPDENDHKISNQIETYIFDKIAIDIAKFMGFDLDSGRIDTSSHPFCGGYSEDVRITHDFDKDNFVSALYALIHESGHGLYEQSLPQEWRNQLVGQACGYGAHEASALLHEFFIGKNNWFLERIMQIIGDHAGSVNKTALINEVRKVRASNPIRMHADMVTYPLHIFLRFDIEKLLFNNILAVDDIPDYWRQSHEKIFGVKIKSDSDGCLQDIHWYQGYFGYFPSYCVGLMYAAQLYYSFDFQSLKAIEDLKERTSNLKKFFYQYASLYSFEELVEKSTNNNLNTSC